MYTELKTPKGRLLLAIVHIFGLAISSVLLTLGCVGRLPAVIEKQTTAISQGVFSAFLVSAIGFSCLCILKRLSGESRIDEINILSSRETRKAHENSLSTTTFWKHDGHFGNWVRSNVLRKLLNKAIRHSARHRVEFLILDPRCDQLMDAYVRFRNGFEDKGHYPKWTVDLLRAEIFTTVLMAALYSANDGFLDCSVWLRKEMIAHRSDCSSDVVFVTSVDPSAPSLTHAKGSAFYSLAEHQFDIITKLADRVDLSCMDPCPQNKKQITPQWVSETLTAMELGKNLSEPLLAAIVSKIEKEGLP